MTCNKIHSRVSNLLNNLGASGLGVARKLLRSKVRGDIDNPSSCPIANYLTKRLGKDFRIKVFTGEVRVGIGDERHEIDLPFPVKDFISRFDDGKFPKLVRK